jgi:glyoxylase-like metal-dependent hydrolase (beta-lactamase superfamily II)
MPFSIQRFSFGNMDNACIVATDKTAKKLVMFDAPFGCEALLKEFPGFELSALLLTHAHYDHIFGARAVQEKATQVLAHIGDERMYSHPEVMAAWLDPEEAALLSPVRVTRYLGHDETFDIAGLKIDARHSPGHSKGGLVFYLPELKAAVVGDSLFRGSIGRTDLPGGSHGELLKSIRDKIFSLPDDTRLFPGHGEETTVGWERTNNPFLQ